MAPVSVTGYPFWFSVRTSNALVGWADGYVVDTHALSARIFPWSLHRVQVTATGGFTVILPAAADRPPLKISGETLRGRAGFLPHSAWPTEVGFTADTVTASRSQPESQSGAEAAISTLSLTGTRPDSPPRTDTDVAVDLTIQANDIGLPVIGGNLLGATIKQARLHVQLMGVPPDAPNEAGLKAWRDAGGTMNLPELSLDWGPLTLAGDGTAALDANMQPEGAFSARISGFDQTIDALAAAGWIKPSAGDLAKLALGLAAMPGPDGKPTVKIPVTIQKRRISVGPAKLGQLPELHLD